MFQQSSDYISRQITTNGQMRKLPHQGARHGTVDHGDASDGVFLLHLWVLPSSWAILLRRSPVGVLERQTYQGGTRGSRLCGGDHDQETENSKVCARTRDIRFIQVRAAKVVSPTSCLGIKYGALCLVLVEIKCPTRYPALLYIVQGAGS
jgi:hypothetical protein